MPEIINNFHLKSDGSVWVDGEELKWHIAPEVSVRRETGLHFVTVTFFCENVRMDDAFEGDVRNTQAIEDDQAIAKIRLKERAGR